MNYLKKFFIASFIFLFNYSFLSAAEFSISPVVSYSDGTLEERWYADDNGNYASLLEWDRNIFLYGIDALCSVETWKIAVGFMAGIPGNCGTMRDSDWMNPDNLLMKTTYSTGVDYARLNFDSSAGISKSFSLYDSEGVSFSVAPVVSLRYKYDSFERTDATGWYGQKEYSSDGEDHWYYDDEAQQFPYSYYNEDKGRTVTRKLAGVSYVRNSLWTWIGICGEFSVFQKFHISLSGRISPYAFIYGIDTHHGSETEYKEIQHAAFTWVSVGIEGTVKFNSFISLKLAGDSLFGASYHGCMFINNALYSKDYTGTAECSFSGMLGIVFNIL